MLDNFHNFHKAAILEETSWVKHFLSHILTVCIKFYIVTIIFNLRHIMRFNRIALLMESRYHQHKLQIEIITDHYQAYRNLYQT